MSMNTDLFLFLPADVAMPYTSASEPPPSPAPMPVYEEPETEAATEPKEEKKSEKVEVLHQPFWFYAKDRRRHRRIAQLPLVARPDCGLRPNGGHPCRLILYHEYPPEGIQV